jgi:hypothetical protein
MGTVDLCAFLAGLSAKAEPGWTRNIRYRDVVISAKTYIAETGMLHLAEVNPEDASSRIYAPFLRWGASMQG